MNRMIDLSHGRSRCMVCARMMHKKNTSKDCDNRDSNNNNNNANNNNNLITYIALITYSDHKRFTGIIKLTHYACYKCTNTSYNQ